MFGMDMLWTSDPRAEHPAVLEIFTRTSFISVLE